MRKKLKRKIIFGQNHYFLKINHYFCNEIIIFLNGYYRKHQDYQEKQGNFP